MNVQPTTKDSLSYAYLLVCNYMRARTHQHFEQKTLAPTLFDEPNEMQVLFLLLTHNSGYASIPFQLRSQSVAWVMLSYNALKRFAVGLQRYYRIWMSSIVKLLLETVCVIGVHFPFGKYKNMQEIWCQNIKLNTLTV